MIPPVIPPVISPVRHIADMQPYALATLDAPDGKSLLSLSQNESLRPPSPLAIKAASDAMAAAHLYPDPEWRALTSALAARHDIEARNILCGNGSMELIACLTQAFGDEHNAVLAPAHAYPFFRTAAKMVRARFDTAPEITSEDGITVSVDTLLDAVRPDTRIVFVANPGNPTGTRISRAELIRLRGGLRADILLVIDEAYGEFSDHLNEPMFDLVARGDTVILRTLSKAYGLAGMRVGWGLFPDAIAAQLRKVLNPNNISVAGQAAANVAVQDHAYMRETCAVTARLGDAFAGRLRQSGFDVGTSFTNFVLIRLVTCEAAQSANELLIREGVFLRPQAGAGLGDCLRATIGDADALDKAAGLLERWAEKEMI